MENFIKNYKTNSYGSILIHYKNKTYQKNFGFQNKNKKISNKTQFRIFSLTKPIAAVAILILVDINKLKLTDTINKYGLDKIPYSDKITILQLLNHMSGINDLLDIPYKKNIIKLIYPKKTNKTTSLSINTILNILQKTKPYSKPNKKFKYNNLGYDLLGYIIQYITKIPTTKFIENYIFKKLQIINYSFHSNKLNKNIAIPLSNINPYKKAILEEQNNWGLNGSINMSLLEYKKFIKNYKKLLSKNSFIIFNNLYFNWKYKSLKFMEFQGIGDFEDINSYSKINGKSKSICISIPKKKLILIISQNYVDIKTDLRKLYLKIVKKYLYNGKKLKFVYNKFW